MRRIGLLAVFFLFLNAGNAQIKASIKKWEVVIFLDGFKAKGVLQSVTDSSATIVVRKNYTDEILFSDMHKIKIRSVSNKALTSVAAFFIGGIPGGIIIGTSVSRNRLGEPAGLAGVIGGIGGGLIIGVASAILAPEIIKLFPKKLIIVKQERGFPDSLKQQLLPYCMYK